MVIPMGLMRGPLTMAVRPEEILTELRECAVRKYRTAEPRP